MIERDYHHKKARTSNTQYHWNSFRKYRNFVHRLIKRVKSDYYVKLIKDSKGNSSTLWSSIKQTLPKRTLETRNQFYV